MYVACSTLGFAGRPLDEALRSIREMQFPKADLAVHADGPHVTPAEVAADPGKVAQRLKAAGVPLAAVHAVITTTRGEAVDQLRAVARLARVMTVPVLTVPAAPRGADFDAETRRLRDWARVAEAEGVMLTVETHSETVTGDPAGAAELCRRVPGLGLTLDPSHYLVGPHAATDLEPLYPLVRHVRLRDTGPGPGQFQVRVGQGEIEFGRLLGHLDRCGYDRALTVDIRECPDDPFPAGPEVRKLKYLLESLI
ncbi:MAG: sugar phosphate isomerase/epimerase [Gemmataceae bacterium]|nr:sugar phosphate isomerase/epimerase [Gemmataceae bacterium]